MSGAALMLLLSGRQPDDMEYPLVVAEPPEFESVVADLALPSSTFAEAVVPLTAVRDGVVLPTYREHVLGMDPFAYWPMVRASGSELDLGPRALDLSVPSAVQRLQPGVADTEDFGMKTAPGASPSKSLTGAAAIAALVPPFTLEAWVRLDDDFTIGATQGIMSMKASTSAPSDGFLIHISSGGGFFGNIADGSQTNRNRTVSGMVPQAGKTYHVVYRVDVDSHWLTVNGVVGVTASFTGYTPPSTSFLLGRYQSNAILDGVISAAAIYDRVLSDAEVLENYRLGGSRTARIASLSGVLEAAVAGTSVVAVEPPPATVYVNEPAPAAVTEV